MLWRGQSRRLHLLQRQTSEDEKCLVLLVYYDVRTLPFFSLLQRVADGRRIHPVNRFEVTTRHRVGGDVATQLRQRELLVR